MNCKMDPRKCRGHLHAAAAISLHPWGKEERVTVKGLAEGRNEFASAMVSPSPTAPLTYV